MDYDLDIYAGAIAADKAAVAIIRAACRGERVRVEGEVDLLVQSARGIRREARWLNWDTTYTHMASGISAPGETIQIWLGHIEDGDWSPDQPTPWEE